MQINPHWTTNDASKLLSRTQAEWEPLNFETPLEVVLSWATLNTVQISTGLLAGPLFLYVAFRSGWYKQNAANLLSTQLCITSTVYAITIFMSRVTLLARREWSFMHCILDGTLHPFILSSYLIILLFTSLERYKAIVLSSKVELKFVWTATVIGWVVAGITTSAHWITITMPIISNAGIYCSPGFGLSGPALAFSIIDASLVVVNAFAILVAYGSIISKLRANYRQIKANRKQPLGGTSTAGEHRGSLFTRSMTTAPRFRDIFCSSSSRSRSRSESQSQSQSQTDAGTTSGFGTGSGSAAVAPVPVSTLGRSARTSVSPAVPVATSPDSIATKTKKPARDKDELFLLRTEALLLRRGILVFSPFSVTWFMLVAHITHMVSTGTRVPAWYDQVMFTAMCMGPTLEPLIILAVDRNFRREAGRALPWLNITRLFRSKSEK
ncbi:hypothetical protein H9P43_004471 [Blastocladiella emersonii ATCC 22665]|nr:hypothetical protein H9P43_004471 [Blastocladiella emersonii ATCC 22665]